MRLLANYCVALSTEYSTIKLTKAMLNQVKKLPIQYINAYTYGKLL